MDVKDILDKLARAQEPIEAGVDGDLAWGMAVMRVSMDGSGNVVRTHIPRDEFFTNENSPAANQGHGAT